VASGKELLTFYIPLSFNRSGKDISMLASLHKKSKTFGFRFQNGFDKSRIRQSLHSPATPLIPHFACNFHYIASFLTEYGSVEKGSTGKPGMLYSRTPFLYYRCHLQLYHKIFSKLRTLIRRSLKNQIVYAIRKFTVQY
jgi:hypothetical protein